MFSLTQTEDEKVEKIMTIPVVSFLVGVLAILAGIVGKVVWIDGKPIGQLSGIYFRIGAFIAGALFCVLSIILYFNDPSSATSDAKKDTVIQELQRDIESKKGKLKIGQTRISALEEELESLRLRSRIVLLMDTTDPARVYNPAYRNGNGLTNADEVALLLQSNISGKPIAFMKELITPSWIQNRSTELSKLNLELIIIHGSGFSKDQSGNDRADTFIEFLDSIDTNDTPMIVYSRSFDSNNKRNFCTKISDAKAYNISSIFLLKVECLKKNSEVKNCSFQSNTNIINVRNMTTLLLDGDAQTNPLNSCSKYIE